MTTEWKVFGDPPAEEYRALERRDVVCCIITTDQGILLGRMPNNRGMYPNQWGFIGGGMELGETTPETAIREAREEAGLDIEIIDALPHQEAFGKKLSPDEPPKLIHALYHYFRCKIVGGTLTPNKEFEEMRFVPKDELPTLDINEPTQTILRQLGYLPEE